MAADYFLKIEGIPGESTDSAHKDEIQLESWSWGQTQIGVNAAGGGGGSGKVQMQDFSFVMKTNKASPALFLNCAQGDHIAKATLVCRKAGGGKQQDYLKLYFEDLLVSSFHISGQSTGDSLPLETVSLNFTKIKYEYSVQNEKGALGAPIIHGYNLKEMKKI